MRGLKSTLALFVVLAGLSAYIYFVVSEQDDSLASDREEVFESFEPDAVGELTVKSDAGEVTTLKKAEDRWQIVSPISGQASDSEVSAVTSALDQLEVVRVIEEKPASLEPYGLAPARLEVGFRSADGLTSGRLLVGSKTPTGANLYAMREGEPQVFMIPAYQESSLNKSTFGLRDKALVRFERDKVTGVTVANGSETIQLQKGDGAWTLIRPVKARADFGTAEGLVGRLETAQIASVVSEDSPQDELEKYGLESRQRSITLDGADTTVILGAKAGDDAVYARDASRNAVLTIANALVDDLLQSAEEYRRRDMFEFRAFNATRVAFDWAGTTVTFERVKGEGENAQDSWRRAGPSASDADKSTVESLLTGLADIRATEFVGSTAGTGLDNPVLTVAVSFEEGTKEERVSFGRRGDEVYASRPDDAGAARVEAEKLDEAIQLLDKLSQ